MTVQYAIVAFPTINLAEEIEAVRRRFDPLAEVLPAHVTLVFPFANDALAPHLASHVANATSGVAAFDIGLAGPAVADSEYIFLNVVAGLEPLVRLHDRLYSGLLGPYLSPTHCYRPHITIGRLAAADHLADAAREAQTTLHGPLTGRVTELAVFRLDQPSHGTVRFTVPLVPSA